MDLTNESLDRAEVDQYGPDDLDGEILLTLMENFSGGPAGLGTISMAAGEEKDAIDVLAVPVVFRADTHGGGFE
jgi:Holliday junction DNA helicase RuvB